MPPDGCHHFIECHHTKVFSIVVFASTGFAHGRQEGPFFGKILKINVVIVIMDSIDG
jgi:hypothetical protein